MTLSLVVAAVIVSAVLVQVVRSDRRDERWERDLIERAFESDDDPDPHPDRPGGRPDEE